MIKSFVVGSIIWAYFILWAVLMYAGCARGPIVPGEGLYLDDMKFDTVQVKKSTIK